MAIVKMKHLRLLAMRQDREDLLRLLQRMGCVEIDEPEERPEGLAEVDATLLARARERRGEGERALAALARYTGKKAKGRCELTEQELFDPERLERGEAAVQDVLDTERQVSALRARQTKLESEREALAPWLMLDVPLDTPSTREVTVLFGTLPASVELSRAAERLLAESQLVQLTPAGSDADRHYLMLLYHNSVAESVTQQLKEMGWVKLTAKGWSGTAQENDTRIQTELTSIARQIEQLETRLTELDEARTDMEQMVDHAAVDEGLEENASRLLDTQTTFYLEGWVPQDRADSVRQALEERALCAIELTDPEPEDYPRVPIKLKNGLLSRCMNVITEMYSMPAYDGIDPNPFMFPFFVLFFGIMMADMGYGILMIAASLVVLLRGKPSQNTRNFMEGVLWCGVSTFVVGALTGGFFGDLIPQMAKLINPESTLQLPALFTPLDDTMAIMIGSVALGCVQIVTGMAISVVHKIRHGEFLDALFDEITWWIILGGTALAIFGIGTVSGVPVVLVVGVLMLVLGGTRKAKGFGKLSSLVGLVYNGVTGFFSDALSYVRLMALMLSGSVIASVFNTLGATFGNVILFLIVAMIGNALNLALNLLGCYVHDLRLQCLEFFGRFYKEGGRPYAPLSYQTKYTDIIKEEK